jgi:hypothetical protein
MTTKIKSGVISDNAITSAHISSGAISSGHLSSIDTDAVSEGSSNLYFTTTRARTSLSVTDSGGDGSLAYDNSTGAITYTGPSASEVRAHLSAGTGVTYSSGEFSIGQSVATTASPTFADINVTGNINVTGDLNTVSVTDLDVTDQTITLGAGQNEAASDGSGIVIAGSSASILWDEPNDEFDFNKSINVTGNIAVSGTVDGVDIAARDAVLTSTTTTAGAALPKAGGTLTGTLNINNSSGFGNIELGGSSGGYVDFKTPFSDDYDARIIYPGGYLQISTYNNEPILLKHNESEKLRTTATGIDVTGNATFDDDGKAMFGAGSDLQIYHNGDNSFIDEVGIGILYIRAATDLRLTNADSSKLYANFEDGGASKLYHDNALSIFTTTAGAEVREALTIGSSSNGLGTTAGNQLTPLTLRSETANTDRLLFTTERLADGTNWTTAAHRIQRKVDVTKSGYIQFGSHATDGDLITFGKNATEYMRIRSDGKVGIGTTSPDGNLHIFSSSAGTVSAASDANELVLEAAANVGMTFLSGNSAVARIRFGDADSNARGNIFYNHSTDLFGFQTAGSTKLTLTQDGELGIGTANPSALLHLKSTVNATGPSLIFENTNNAQTMNIDYWNNAGAVQSRISYAEGPASWNFIPNVSTGASALYIAYNGNVGIGETDPETSLHIKNAGNSFLTLERSGTTGGTGKFGINMEGGSSQQTTMSYDDGGKLIIGRSSDPATAAGFNNDFILKGGFVGIKTLDPQVELHVTGNANISGSTTSGGVITSNNMIRSDAGHTTARVEAVYDDGAAQYDSNILMWVSEPGYTYDSGGIGVNIHESGHYYGRKYDNDYAVFMRFQKSDGAIQFGQNQGTSGTGGASQVETLKITANGTLRLATTGGIGFGTTNAADTLDDYEEGNFTPTFVASGGTAPSSQTGTGQYTKIGDVVHLTGQIVWNGAGSGGSNLYISIPFNVISDARAGLAVGLNSGVNYAQDHTLHLVPEINTNVIYLVSTHYSVSGHTHLSYSNISNAGSKIFSFSGSFHTRD